ncbi:hypothetical protein SAMN05660652_01977 [Propionivibrio dicarboxylicus]|uniref:Capsule polysaccharide biosynthesis protein n=2 Tax=Propionivibrio dicarboxylicus TaxID=83767 RepID=A0A1G8DY80_9RHOO|nr:hypothetical protein SAMN05660652_01977 [Propionivibrio dicarboxylicus]
MPNNSISKLNNSFISRIIRRIRSLRPLPATSNFIEHNRRVFTQSPAHPDAPVVLMEFNEMHSSHIAYSYLANCLAKKNDARIVAHFPRPLSNLRERLSFFLRSTFGLDAFGVYRSFGCSEFLAISLDAARNKRAEHLLGDISGRLRTKVDLESLSVDGVWIGDLIYDTYLMRFRRPTVDLESQEFRDFLLESLDLFLFWQDYFKSHRIAGISVSHCVYNLAMPLRIAVLHDIPVFQATLTHIYRPNRDNLFAYNDFFHYRSRYAALPTDVQRAGLEQARERIERRFSGEVGVDMHYSSKSAYGNSRHQQLLKPSPRKKILVATHCFFDSPHSYGNNLFPDFLEWLEFLGQISKESDYDWYIKTHPDYLPGTMEIIRSFIDRYPKFSLLPANASHHQIIGEGIDVALTVYGTIAFEYAALGKTVINCSINNPHIAYDFNLHPRSVGEYRAMLLNIDQLTLTIDKKQVHEYYFMHHLYSTHNMFVDDYAELLKSIGGYSAQFTPEIYDKWLQQWTPRKHQKLLAALDRFVDSGDFRMEYNHFSAKESEDRMEGQA